jgi:methionyl-tRNA formyltransferase
MRHGIDIILQPESVRDESFATQVQELDADIIVVVAFRILPPEVFSASRLGTFNLHGSLLPLYRGAAPIHRAVMDGATETGVTTFFLKERVDTGNIILKRSLPIGPNETTGDVYARMMILGASAVIDTVQMIVSGSVVALPQDDTQATAAPKVFSTEAQIPWESPALVVHNHIRGLSPIPGAHTQHGADRLKMYRSEIWDNASEGSDKLLGGSPGTILKADDELVVQCGDGMVAITDLQAPGKKRMPARQFLLGYPIEPGEVLH